MATSPHSPLKPHVSSLDVEGVKIYDIQGKRLGVIDHLVIEKATGRVVSVDVNMSGFFGIGHSHSQLPWSALHYNSRLNGYQVSLTENEIVSEQERRA
jgi:sporulation protein YlmC with PRC-barrel domain